MSMNAGALAYKLSFQVSPIILVGGIAQLIPGGMLPIIAITEALNFTIGLLSGGDDISTDSFFANFQPLSGGSLIETQYGEYPFANQAVAANAAIAQPTRISMRMVCPARAPGGFAAKLATITALKTTIQNHINTGGTFTVATPSYIYTNCLLTDLRDVTSGNPDQPQSAWQWDFKQPLITEEQANFAMNSAMDRYTRGTPWSGAISGLPLSVGAPLSLAAPSILPAASNLAGSNVATSIFSG